MTVERARQLLGSAIANKTDKEVEEQIAQDRQLIQAFIEIENKNRLTLPSESGHYGN